MVNFPDSLDDDATLFAAVNNLRTRLTVPISDTDTTIPVITTSGFPATGYFTILSSSDITKAEAIKYDTFSATQFTGVTRGADGTTAVEHLPNDNVDFNVVADHHNALKEATIKLEHFVGSSGVENFVFRNPDTAQGTVDGNLLVSGTSAFNDTVDMKQRLTVSGIAQFGPIPASTLPLSQAIFNDTPATTTAGSFQTVMSDSPLDSDVNLVLYRGNLGIDSSGDNDQAVEIRALFSGVQIGLGGGIASPSSTRLGHFYGAEIAGFKVITGDGVNSSAIQVRRVSGSVVMEYSTLGIVSVPLGAMGLVENTDYWFDNGSDANNTTTPGSSSFVDKDFMDFTVPSDGEYLIMFSSELKAGLEGRMRVELDPSSGDFLMETSETGSTRGCPVSFTVIRTLTAGSHTLQMQQGADGSFGSTSTSNRTRFFVLRVAAFDQIQGIRSATDQGTTSATPVVLTEYSQTYSPNQLEQVLVIGSAGYTTSNDDSSASYKLVNITDVEEYRVDAGQRIFNGTNSNTTSNRTTMFFHLLPAFSTPKDFEIHFRNSSASGFLVTNVDGALVFWGLSLPPAIPDILITTISIDEITTHQVDLDIFTATQSAAVSGTAVMIGLPDEATFQNINTTNITVTGTADFHTAAVDILTVVSGAFSESLTVSGFPVTINASVFDPSADETVTGSWNFSSSLTVSGIPVSTGTGGGGVSDHGALTGLADNDHPQYGQLADAESVAGVWDFSTGVTVSGFPVSTGTLTVRETDGTPTVLNVNTIVVTTGTLTDDGGGQVTIDTGGGGGGGGTTDHAALDNLDFSNAGHIGFASESELLSVSGSLQSQIGSSPSQYRSALLSTTSGVSYTSGVDLILPWDTVSRDVGGWFDSGKDTRLTVPANVDYVRLWGALRYASNATNDRWLTIRKNGGADQADPNEGIVLFKTVTGVTGQVTIMGGYTPVLKVVEGDYFTLVGRQLSGITLAGDSNNTAFFIEEIKDVISPNDEITAASGTFTQSLTISGISVPLEGAAFDPTTDETITGAWDFSNSLTVSGIPVATGSGEWMIHQEFTDATSTSITFDIPQSARVLEISHSVRSTGGAAVFNSMLCQFNGDTGSNYARHQMRHDDDADTPQYLANTTTIILGVVPGPGAVANSFGAGSYTLPNYANTTVYKSITGTAMAYSDDAHVAGDKSRITTGGGTWLDTSAVTQIRLFHSASVFFDTGSSITIRGY